MNVDEFPYKELTEGLRLMASPYDVQVASLPDFAHVPDEILNAIPSDAWNYMAEVGLISAAVLEDLRSLDSYLDEIPLPEDYEGMLSQVRCGVEFEELRTKARELLLKLGEKCQAPDFGYVVWIKSR
jgi:hypothetical protein